MLATIGLDAIGTSAFWVALLEITGINILLSGDNAVVIALACRSLPDHQRNKAVIGGSLGAILMRVLFCVIIAWLLEIPYLKLVGGLLLLWIGIKLLVPEHEGDGVEAKSSLWGAIQTIILADAVMSLDNVVAIAAAAKGSILLIVLGLVMSVPLIVFGSQLVLTLLQRFPVLVMFGAGLLGWIAGEIISTDPAMERWTGVDEHTLELYGRPVLAAAVVALGTLWARLARKPALVDLAPEERR
jgi:YjbE family integral membrane protein